MTYTLTSLNSTNWSGSGSADFETRTPHSVYVRNATIVFNVHTAAAEAAAARAKAAPASAQAPTSSAEAAAPAAAPAIAQAPTSSAPGDSPVAAPSSQSTDSQQAYFVLEDTMLLCDSGAVDEGSLVALSMQDLVSRLTIAPAKQLPVRLQGPDTCAALELSSILAF